MTEYEHSPRAHIVGFESMEEIMSYMAEAEETAIAQTLPEQWDITWGDYVIRRQDDVAIFGVVFTEDELSFGTEASPEEIEEELRGLRSAYGRGYRYGRWFSIVEPNGELGSAHVCSLWKISQDDFELARGKGWVIWSDLANRMYHEISGSVVRKGKTEES